MQNPTSSKEGALWRRAVKPVYLCYEAAQLVKALNLHESGVGVLPFITGRARSLKWMKLANDSDDVNAPGFNLPVIHAESGATTNTANSRAVHEISGAAAHGSSTDMPSEKTKCVEMSDGKPHPSDTVASWNDLIPPEDWEVILREVGEYLRLNADYRRVSRCR